MQQYQPLYLKYRPQVLSELIGQEVVIKTLSNAINYNKIVHAYLFCGPRGTGKTSTARILAKSLNCEKGSTTSPCGKCNSCVSITDGSSLDVIEIDAASHRKVEDAEDLVNRVSLGTYGSHYKIFIIDEVHMLTDHAFNALLKTLEEPPQNVIFILATTEEHKVLPTIISRCQKLDFKPIAKEHLIERLEEVAKKEKINLDKNILNFISKKAGGCLRDAISLLDQISVLQEGDKKIKSEDVFELFGTVDRLEIFRLLKLILLFDKKNAIDKAESLVSSGKDILELIKLILELTIDLGKAKINDDYKKILQEELNEDLSFLEKINQNHILKIIDRMQDAQSKLRFALSQELQFMVEIMSLLDEDFIVSITELKEKILNLEKMFSSVEKLPEIKTPSKPVVEEVLENEPASLPIPENAAISLNPVSNLDSTWVKIVSSIESTPTRALLGQCESYLIEVQENIIEIGISKDMFLPRLKNDEKKKEMILQATKIICGFEPKELKFKVQIGNSPLKQNTTKKTTTTSSPTTATPQNEPTNVPTKQAIPSSINDDELTRAVKDLLGGKQI